MFTIGQTVYHKFLHQKCVVVGTHVEPEFVWSDGKVDEAFDWVDVKLADGSVVGGDADGFSEIRAREIGPLMGAVQVALYYRRPNFGICDVGYFIISCDQIRTGADGQRLIQVRGEDYPLD